GRFFDRLASSDSSSNNCLTDMSPGRAGTAENRDCEDGEMRQIRVAAAQFENRDNDKQYNLARIEALTRRAVEQGAEIVSFHEGCIPGYSWIQPLTKPQLLEVAEPIPDGPSVRRLCELARQFNTVIMAGLFERDSDHNVFNCYVTVGPDGFITKF